MPLFQTPATPPALLRLFVSGIRTAPRPATLLQRRISFAAIS
jgi:hypothetical protein